MRHIFLTTLRNLLFLTLPAAVGLIVLAVPIVRLLLQRGAFDDSSTYATAWALAFFSVGLVGHTVVEIATRAFYALRNTKTPVAIGILAMVVNLIFSLLLMRLFEQWSLPPHGGLALANSIAILLEMVIMLFLLRGPMGGLSEAGLTQSLVKMSVAALGMALALLVVMPLLPNSDAWWAGIVGIVIGGVVYFGLAFVLRLHELQVIQRKVLGRLRR